MNNPPSEPITLAARVLPRNVVDCFISAVIGTFQSAVLLFAPAFVVGFAAESTGLGILTFAIAYGLFLSFSVRAVTLSSDGLRFLRVLGAPRYISWKSISSIEEVSRFELICRGWLWPLFPAREMTVCLSSLGHYRITWKDGYCYFPPADARRFEALVAQMSSATAEPS